MGSWKGRCWHGEDFPFTAMVTVECINVGLSTIFKAATLKGLNYHVFMLYFYGISVILLLPLCFFFHRKSRLPPFTFGLLARFFFLGILGFVGQYLRYIGYRVEYSSPTQASAVTNLVPAPTFILAVLVRFSFVFQGAQLVDMYKGPVPQPALVRVTIKQYDWVKGGALLAVECAVASI